MLIAVLLTGYRPARRARVLAAFLAEADRAAAERFADAAITGPGAAAGRPPMEVVLTAFPFVMETPLSHFRRPLAGTLNEQREDIKRLSRDRKILSLMLDCPLCYSTLDFPFICSQRWLDVRLR